MKAEHRKELQTNVLADRMGRLVQRIKERPKRRTTLYLVLGLAVVVAVVIYTQTRKAAASERSERWVKLEDGFAAYIEQLIKEPDTNPGKAATLQLTWLATWDNGMLGLGRAPARSVQIMELLGQPNYRNMAKECADDPVWEPEALYGQAVIEESLAIRAKNRSEHLDKAQAMFQKLAHKHKNSARGKDAARRAEILEKQRTQVVSFYRDLQELLNVPEEEPDEPKLNRNKK